MSENHKVIEIHGCIVCARVFNVLAVYSPDGRLVDCSASNPDGHCLLEEHQLLVACNSHTGEDIEAAITRWRSRKIDELDED